MKSNRNLTGDEFTALVAQKLGRQLVNSEIISTLYESAKRGGLLSAFDDLALYAKSYQKVTRLLSGEKTDEQTRNVAAAELKSLVTKFTDSAEVILATLPEGERAGLRSRYFTVTHDSFRNLQTLISDFVGVKDFLLSERDVGT